MVRIKRVELDGYGKVSAIEFYEDSYPSEVMDFLVRYKIGKNFQPPLTEKETEELIKSVINKAPFMRP